MQGAPINDFITKIKSDGLARTNRFAVTFGFPAVLGGGSNPYKASPYDAALLCENVQLPGINLNTIQNRTFGEFRETPYETMYDNITATFYVDREMKIKHLFDTWILAIQGYNGPSSGTGSRNFRYYNEYITDMQIYVNDTLNQTYYGVNLYEVYPKTISSITLDNNSKEIMKMTVTLQYKFWRPGQFSNRAQPVPYTANQNPTPIPTGPQPVTQLPMWQDAWNDVNEWLGDPLPGFNAQNSQNWDLPSLPRFSF
jgi:hypothetical protein